MNEVTQIISAIQDGDAAAAKRLLPLVYHELRRLAAQKMAHESPGQTLQATALVHEAYLRLVGSEGASGWDSRGHFFAAAAEAMRRILVENARRKQSLKRGGRRQRLDLVEADLVAEAADEKLLALEEALAELAEKEPRCAELVKLRYFGGLTIEEAAQILEISPRTAKRDWAYARAWLRRRMQGDGDHL